ncbi:MAG: hypothetical protein IPG06_11735 [Haliea sp.]|nr:hypothetical protein [Haliea sp.]
MLISITEISNLTGADRRRIRSLLADLEATKEHAARCAMSPGEALPRLYVRDDGDFDLTSERARLAHFQANAAQLTAKHLEGSLIPIEQVADVVGDEYANVRAKLLAIPAKAAPQVVGLSTVAIRTRLDDLIRSAWRS